MAINTHEGFNNKHSKTQVINRCLTRTMKQYASIGRKTPVVMLTRTINSVEWLFVEQYLEAVLSCNLLHDRHEKHVVVNSKVSFFEDWSELKLIRSNLIMTCLTRNTQFKSLNFKLFHESLHTLWDSTEIVVVHLLVLGTIMSHKSATCKHKVRTSCIKIGINKEIFLFPAKVACYFLYIRIEITTHIGSCNINSMKGTKQRSFVVESLTCVRNEDSWNTKSIVDNEYRRCWIPCTIATSFESVTDTA